MPINGSSDDVLILRRAVPPMDAGLDVLSANEGWNDLSNRADARPEI